MSWLAGWGFRKKITIQNANVAANLTWFPLYVKISADADLHEALATGYDIRFTQSDGTTLLSYERESWTGGNGSAATADFWVSATGWVIATAATTDIYMYYGNSTATDGEGVAGVWDGNFKGVWHLSESAGTATDSSGNSNTGTFVGSLPTQIAGKVYKAQDFDGSGDYVSIQYSAELKLANTGTIEAWLQQAATPAGSHAVIQYDEDSYTSGYVFNQFSDDLWLYWKSPGAAVQVNNVLTTEVWQYLVLKNDNGTCTGYYNYTTTNTGTSGGAITSEDVTYIGSGLADITGQIDEVRISNTARADAWIKFTYYNINEEDNELTWISEEKAPGGGGSLRMTMGMGMS